MGSQLLWNLNVAHFQSRSVADSKEWNLNPKKFKMICKALGSPNIDLFVSRMSHQLPMYISWKPDPFISELDAFQQSKRYRKDYYYFCLKGKVLRKIQIDMPTIILKAKTRAQMHYK